MLDRLLSAGSLPLLVVALLLAGLGVPIPEDPVLLAAGITAHRSLMPAWVVLAVVYASVIAADCVIFFLARHFGRSLLEKPLIRRFLTPERQARVSGLFLTHGSRAVFVGRHLAGLRVVVFATAGIEGMALRSFVLWDGLAALITVPTMFSLGYFFSAHVAAIERGIAHTEHWIAAILALVALVAWLVWSLRNPRNKAQPDDAPPSPQETPGTQPKEPSAEPVAPQSNEGEEK